MPLALDAIREVEPQHPKLEMLALHLRHQHPLTATRWNEVMYALECGRTFVRAHTPGDGMIRVVDAVRYHHAVLDPFGGLRHALLVADYAYSVDQAREAVASLERWGDEDE